MEETISANGADKTGRAKAEKEEPWEEKQRGASRPVNQYSSFKQHKGLPVQIWETREIFSLSDVSYFLSDAVVSTTAENKVGEESVHFILHLPVHEQGKSGQQPGGWDRSRDRSGMLLTSLLRMSRSGFCFIFMQPRTICPGPAPPQWPGSSYISC